MTVNLRFPGQYFDAESDLHYNWNRYYNPETGRYISSDPIGLDGGLNTYLYANASPMMFVDPEGLDLVLVGQGGDSGALFQLTAKTWINENPGDHKYVLVTTGKQIIEAIEKYASENEGYVDGLQYFGHSNNIALFVNQGDGINSLYHGWLSNQSGDAGAAFVSDINPNWFNRASKIGLWGCNAGAGLNSIAQNFADHTKATVRAATGPTTFSGVKAGRPGQNLPNPVPSNYSKPIYLVPQYADKGFEIFTPAPIPKRKPQR